MKNKECRICYQYDSIKNLISPCECIGTLKHVHKHCIETFIESTENENFKTQCYICNVKYDFIQDESAFTFTQYVCLVLASLGFLFYFSLIIYIVAQFASQIFY